MSLIITEFRDGVYRVRLSRPEVRNALNDGVLSELKGAFDALPGTAKLVLLSGDGPAFCAGADAEWMKRSRNFGREENERDASAVAAVLRSVDECPVPVVGRIQGAALGGGAGLAATCDVAIAEEGTQFGFPEVRLGLVPAVISTFVVPRIGIGAARRYFLTGERFGAVEARSMGLVHEVAPAGKLDERVQAILSELLKGGSQAQRAAKKLLRNAPHASREQAIAETVRVIAEIRVGPEAQEGLRAFLEKRKPNWT